MPSYQIANPATPSPPSPSPRLFFFPDLGARLSAAHRGAAIAGTQARLEGLGFWRTKWAVMKGWTGGLVWGVFGWVGG